MNILISVIFHLLTNFSNLSFTNVDGNIVSMSSFSGKKVMIVNIATGSPKLIQEVNELQQLQQQYADKLVVIVFPSNSYGHENRSDTEIKELIHNNYHTTFIIASKSAVTGTYTNSVYSWLTQKEQNGDLDTPMGNDFQKFIVGENGKIVGSFSSKVNPMDSTIIELINTPYNN